MKGRGKREISEKTRRPVASCGTITTCKNPGIAPSSPRQNGSCIRVLYLRLFQANVDGFQNICDGGTRHTSLLENPGEYYKIWRRDASIGCVVMFATMTVILSFDVQKMFITQNPQTIIKLIYTILHNIFLITTANYVHLVFLVRERLRILNEKLRTKWGKRDKKTTQHQSVGRNTVLPTYEDELPNETRPPQRARSNGRLFGERGWSLQKKGSDKGLIGARKCRITSGRKAPNWRGMVGGRGGPGSPSLPPRVRAKFRFRLHVTAVSGGVSEGIPNPGTGVQLSLVRRSLHNCKTTLGQRWLSDYHARLPPRRTGFNPRPGDQLFASENIAGRCRWSAGFLGDLPFPPTLHSSAAPYSLQSPLSALKTSICYLSNLTIPSISKAIQIGLTTGILYWRDVQASTAEKVSQDLLVADLLLSRCCLSSLELDVGQRRQLPAPSVTRSVLKDKDGRHSGGISYGQTANMWDEMKVEQRGQNSTPGGNRRASRKPASQRQRPPRFPHVKICVSPSENEPSSPWREANALAATHSAVTMEKGHAGAVKLTV
ncbi:hypothetical protein PR048_025903 [Dryococelus australis]|uniref:Uncharacterized protein n=1 Tax=Dryococelus australis TaxID=614101 RepID=A0ABQ9GJW2_9NEOP|nr:hypothetical protein PR048_025903 [Dryococelus australis]